MKLASTWFLKILAGKYFLFSFVLLFTFSPLSNSQNIEPRFEHLTVKDGLPENTAKAILQDYLGYMWFGTQAGLVKYDGYDMTIYDWKADTDGSLSSGSIMSIYEDRKKNLWVGTWASGLNRFNRTTETFKSFLHNPNDPSSLGSDIIYTSYEDKKGRLWIGTDEGLDLLDTKSNKFKHFYFSDKSYSKEIFDYILNQNKIKSKVASILKVGNNADIMKTFVVKKKMPVLIVSIGEAGYDYGWLEDSKGNILFNYDYEKTRHAGGAFNNRIQFELIILDEGTYKLYYTSNYFYSYDDQFVRAWSWDYKRRTGEPPDSPEFWGIQILDASADTKMIEGLLKNSTTIEVKSKVFSIIENEITGKIYIGTNSPGLWELDEILNAIKKSELRYSTNSKREIGSVESFCKTKDGSIWIATTVGLCKFNLSANEVDLYQPIPVSKDIIANQLNSLTEDKEGNLWAGTTIEGLLKFDLKKGKFFRYKNELDDPNSLAMNGVLTVCTDRSGIIWIGFWTGGISKWDKQKWKFPLYKIISKQDNVQSINNVNTIYEDKNRNLWVGTQRGLYKYDQDKYFSKLYKRNPDNTHSLSCDSVTYILGDSFNSSVLWVGTENGLNEFNTETEFFSQFFYSPSATASISDNYIKYLLIDHLGLLWIGTRGGGLIKYDKKTGKFIRFLNDPSKGIIIGYNYVHCIYEDYVGNIWFGHDDHGLSKYDRNSGNFTNYNTENFFAARTFYEDKNNKMWIGTYQEGIYLFDQLKNNIISHFTIENGLRDNQINTLLEDKLGNLWISSFSGLTRFSPITGFKYYSVSEGITSAPGIVGRNLYKGISDNIYYCGKEGFNLFNPSDIMDDPTPPLVVIKKVSLFNRPGEKIDYDGFISESKELSLSYNQNDLSFQYVGLHYSEPLNNQYKYILEGFDENWIDAGNQRTVTYTNLDPGDYIFRVNASNRDGVWNEAGTSIKITIHPPLWATTWAYLLYIILALTIIYFLWKLNVRRINTKHEYEMSKFEAEKLHEVDEMKSKFFANISHEFRTPLTLIIGPAKDIIEKSKDNEAKQSAGLIKRSANRLLGLVNQLLDLSKLEAGKMKLETREQDIIALLKGLVLSFSSFAERKKITLNFHTNEEKVMVFFDKDKIEKIINNLLSNAFKFTPEGGKIEVTIEKMIDEIEIRISDSGVGILKENIDKIFDRFYQVNGNNTRDQEGTGIGLALTKELVELHKGKIAVQSEERKGTTFILIIPLGKDHLKLEEIVEKKTAAEIPTLKDDSELLTDTITRKDKTDVEVFLETDKALLLVVEDNSDVRKYIISHLEDNYRIQEAVDGEHGFQQALNHIPDLIISDVMMPKMDGFEMCYKLKTDERTSHIPIIMLTAKATSEDKITGYEIGADDYIMKPFDAAELKVRIKNLIEIRRKLQEKFRSDDFRIPKELSSIDGQFIKRILRVINEHISEEEFSIEELGREAGMSRGQIFKKIKALTGKSPSLFLRSVRLAKAKKMIKDKQGNVSEISFSVGFNSPAYFTKCFSEEYGYLPSDTPKS